LSYNLHLFDDARRKRKQWVAAREKTELIRRRCQCREAAEGWKDQSSTVAQEQQIDLLMTADAVIGISDDILTPVLRWVRLFGPPVQEQRA
jgi:hypothetical protein